jgi:hypothetical protein
MNGQRKPRRVRWPANVDTFELARRLATRVTPAELASVIDPMDDAFKALRKGVASEWQWALLASSVNVAKAIEKKGVVRGMREHWNAADIALANIRIRAMAAGAWKPTALYFHELDTIREAMHLHKFQLQQLSLGEAIDALAYAEAEIRSSGSKVIKTPSTQEIES